MNLYNIDNQIFLPMDRELMNFKREQCEEVYDKIPSEADRVQSKMVTSLLDNMLEDL